MEWNIMAGGGEMSYEEKVIYGILCGSDGYGWYPISDEELTRRLLDAQHSVVELCGKVAELEKSNDTLRDAINHMVYPGRAGV